MWLQQQQYVAIHSFLLPEWNSAQSPPSRPIIRTPVPHLHFNTSTVVWSGIISTSVESNARTSLYKLLISFSVLTRSPCFATRSFFIIICGCVLCMFGWLSLITFSISDAWYHAAHIHNSNNKFLYSTSVSYSQSHIDSYSHRQYIMKCNAYCRANPAYTFCIHLLLFIRFIYIVGVVILLIAL